MGDWDEKTLRLGQHLPPELDVSSLGNLLRLQNNVTREQIQEAVVFAKAHGLKIGQAVVALGLADDTAVRHACESQILLRQKKPSAQRSELVSQEADRTAEKVFGRRCRHRPVHGALAGDCQQAGEVVSRRIMAHIQLVLDNNTRAHLVGDFDDRALDERFAVLVNKQFFRSAAYKHGYHGKKHYYSRKTKSFPAGLYRDVRKFLRLQGHSVALDDKRQGRVTPGPIDPQMGGDITLRDYQLRTVQKALKAERGILHVVTGGGKTELMAALIRAYDVPTLVLTSKATLVQQTRERLAWRLGLDPYDIGIVSQGRWQDGEVPILVALVTTWSQAKQEKKRKAFAERCKLLLIDEGHHAGAPTWYQAAQKIDAYHRFGLTGTPTGRS